MAAWCLLCAWPSAYVYRGSGGVVDLPAIRWLNRGEAESPRVGSPPRTQVAFARIAATALMPKKSKPKKDRTGEDEKETRLAIVSADKCKPKKCRQECKKGCPVVRTGKMCIEVSASSKLAFISEELCVGCGICVKKCPFDAVHIIKLPTNLARETTHRYGPNSFKLHRLPMPRPGQVLGLVGVNGIGKSTALKVLSGKLKPNLGKFDSPPDWQEILVNYRGSELQNYFMKILEDDIKAIIKVQYVDQIPAAVKGTVAAILDGEQFSRLLARLCSLALSLSLLSRSAPQILCVAAYQIAAKHDNERKDEVMEVLELAPVAERTVDKLSGTNAARSVVLSLRRPHFVWRQRLSL